jgi:hypothetical protein
MMHASRTNAGAAALRCSKRPTTEIGEKNCGEDELSLSAFGHAKELSLSAFEHARIRSHTV